MSNPQENRPIAAALWMIGAIVSFSAMAVAGREMAGELDTFEIMTFRSLIGVIVVTSVAYFAGTLHSVSIQNIGLNFVRNIAHFSGQNLWFFAVTVIPFAQLFAFEFSVPIWVMLAAPFFLNERLTSTRVFTILLGFVGILIVTRPWLEPITAGILAAAAAAIGFAATNIATKKLTKIESITCIMFWLTTMQLLFGVICASFDGDVTFPDARNFHWILIVGLGGLVAHFSITKALTLADTTVVLPVDFCRLPIIIFIGYMFYNEPLNIWIVLGAMIIFAANYVNILAERRNTNPMKEKV